MDLHCGLSDVMEVGPQIAGQRPPRKFETAYCSFNTTKLWYLEKLIESGDRDVAKCHNSLTVWKNLGLETWRTAPSAYKKTNLWPIDTSAGLISRKNARLGGAVHEKEGQEWGGTRSQ